jgi:hypothetical protein
MALQYINTGTSANKGDGDSLRVAFHKINQNFSQVQSSSTSSVVISDSGELPAIELQSFGGTFTLPGDNSTSVQLFEFDKRIYRGASIDILAENQTTDTQDSGSSYMVTWNSTTSHVLGTGIVSLFENGSTNNANWDIVDTSIYDNRVRVQAYNVSGLTATNVISWRAQVSLFRL